MPRLKHYVFKNLTEKMRAYVGYNKIEKSTMTIYCNLYSRALKKQNFQIFSKVSFLSNITYQLPEIVLAALDELVRYDLIIEKEVTNNRVVLMLRDLNIYDEDN